MGIDSGEWHVTTDPSSVRQWADEHGAVAVRDPDATGNTGLDVVTPQAESRAGGDVSTERIPWDQFVELFEAEGLAFRYRAGDPADTEPVCQLVDREAVEDTPAETSTTGEAAQSVASDQIAVSDTGDVEPVVEDRVESEGDTAKSPGDGRTDRERARGDQMPERTGAADTADSPESEAARDADEQPLVLEEIYEDPGGLSSDPDDEYVVLRNDGEERLDLGGWRVENGLGETFTFPEAFVLGPSDQVTIHSGDGRDTDADLHWRADDAIWDQTGGTVIVRSPTGETVLSEPYKDG